MPTVRLAFSAAPQYVRTARLVGVAVARRAGVADELLDDIQLAIGEACGRAVARHRRYGVDELVRVEMSDDGPYEVRVIDACGSAVTPAEADGSDESDESEAADRMGETLLAGLVDELAVSVDEHGTEVRMVWPVRRRQSGAGRPAGWPGA
jgi:anti-sigma regulatory factor (Ser/Thr protein kinase)